MIQIDSLQQKCRQMRQDILTAILHCGSGHLASCFSCVEILATLYLGGVLKHDPDDHLNLARNRFILSKGHAAAAMYAVLHHTGFIGGDYMSCLANGLNPYGGLLQRNINLGIEATTGSLGHGLGLGCGMAWAAKQQALASQIYVLIGDGESQEGSIWEGALFAAHHKLDNLMLIVDNNNEQAMGKTAEIIRMDDLATKWSAFGWHTISVDGHNISSLLDAFKDRKRDMPAVILANTVKGKGISFLEQNSGWHYQDLTPEQICTAQHELGIRRD